MSLLSCIDASSDYQLRELGLQLHLGDAYLQTHASDYSILSEARSQLTSFPMACQLYLLSKKLIAADERSCYNKHLDTLSVQCKLKDSVSLESCCGTWNRLLLGCNPGHISFVLRVASDTLPTAVNLQRWRIQCSAKCSLCGCTQPTTAHVLGGYPSALTQGRFTFRHNQVYIVWLLNFQSLWLDNVWFQYMLTYLECGRVTPLRQQFLPRSLLLLIVLILSFTIK